MNSIPLSKVCDYSNSSMDVGSLSLNNYITTDNMLPNRGGIVDAVNLPPALTCPKFEKEDILLSNIRPYFKKIWYATFEGGCSTDILVLKCTNEKYYSKYVYYSLFQDLFFKHMLNGAKGSKMPRGDKDQIMTYKVTEYDKPYQKRIADFLSIIDYKISINKQIIYELEQIAKNIYNYWFVQFDFPNEKDKPYKTSGGEMEYNEELKKEIPKGWKVKSLNNIVDVSNDSINPQNFLDKDFKHYSIPTFDTTGTYGIEKGEKINSSKYVVLSNDILVSKLNPWFSRVVFGENQPNIICSTEFVVWRTYNNDFKNYLYMVARDKSFISYCTQNATGTSNSHKRINPTVMMEYTIAYNEIITAKYGQLINGILQMIFTNKKQIYELIQLRDFLLPLLMNGQVKIIGEVDVSSLMITEPKDKDSK